MEGDQFVKFESDRFPNLERNLGELTNHINSLEKSILELDGDKTGIQSTLEGVNTLIASLKSDLESLKRKYQNSNK